MEKKVFEELFGKTEENTEAESVEEEIVEKIDWKRKLSSRKLWAAVIAAVLAVIAAVFGDDLSAETVDMIKTGIYGLIAYIFGEGVVDAARVIGESKNNKE
jgi:uncharacterized membrane protein